MILNSEMRQNIQRELDFSSTPTGESRKAGEEENESLEARHAPKSPARSDRLMEEILDRENLKEALRRVKANKGSPGVDGHNCLFGDTRRGIAVAPGQVKGNARVLSRPDEGCRLSAGEILIVSSADPAWTPLSIRYAARPRQLFIFLRFLVIANRPG